MRRASLPGRALAVTLALALWGCGRGTILVGEPVEDGSGDATDSDGASGDVEEGVDGTSEADAEEEVASDLDADGSEDGPEDVIDDAGPICPVWAVPSGDDVEADGSEAHPFVGLAAALAGRVACSHVILRGGTVEDPFDAAVNIAVGDIETLVIEGDPSSASPAELDAHGEPGLFVTNGGALTLRHLAVRNGMAPTGGCLNAQVGALRLEDTEWTGCRAEFECSAVWVYAPDVEVRDSRFLHNDVPGTTYPPPAAGAACIDGPMDTARILVERCRFEANLADWGHALYVKALTRSAVVRDCVFLGNTSRQGPSALGGEVGELSHNRFEANEVQMDAAVVQFNGTPDTRITHNLFLENRSGRGPVALAPCRGVVANNLFVRNECRNAPGSGWCSAAVWVIGGCSVELRNNSFADNSSEGGIAHLSYDSAFGSVRSNLFVGGDGRAAVGTDYPDWGVSAELSYNAWWMTSEPVFGDGVRLVDGNFEADPLFGGGDDYHLGPGSPAIDAGDPDPSLVDPDGSRNDPGAFGGPDGNWTPLPAGGAP